jgi:hypothetical protein
MLGNYRVAAQLVASRVVVLQQLLLSTGSFLNSSGTNWTNSSSWCNQTARLIRILNSTSNYLLWAGTQSVFELPLDSWTASHCSQTAFSYSLELLVTVLLCSLLFCSVLFCSVLVCRPRGQGYSVRAWIVKRLLIITLAEAWLLTLYLGNSNLQRAWICAYVWLLRNTLPYLRKI